ncbi:g6f-like isoform X2 [Girardinichthys multiradiatus]|uniref:g6f-like isoform X2 n=1 Tax=Girardinichthys multiradiatus TaxID=208333 RepID=UPI001FACABFF|nr:g6f-like isoform X2 [Girardinichthys multiradiatus]
MFHITSVQERHACSCICSFKAWDEVVMVKENTSTTLVCNGARLQGDISINWKVKSVAADEWKLILSASEKKKFSGGASKASMRLTDDNFQDTGDFSLDILPKVEDGGLYSCLIKKQQRKVKERIFLLAVLKVDFFPAAPVPQYSTLRLFARVNPNISVSKITWTAPGGLPMKTEKWPTSGTVTKVPQVQNNDGGTYTCTVYHWGDSNGVLEAHVDVIVDADKVASFTNISHSSEISTATQTHKSLLLACPSSQGDYVLLYWLPPDAKKHSMMKLVYQYNRWSGSTSKHSNKLQLAGPPYDPEAGSFAFLLTPDLKEGGLYACEVYLNDVVFSQRTRLSVLKVKTSHYPSKLELLCLYSERSEIQSVLWKHDNKSRRLQMSSNGPGTISTTLPLPISSDAAGNYTCILQMKNGQSIWAVQAVTVPPTESTTTSSLHPSFSALLLLVPVVAAAVGVLLWRQKHISDRGIEQSLSVQSGEVENIYENPEDIRQAPPQGSVYMDLKPRGDNDVYKELERYEQCQG